MTWWLSQNKKQIAVGILSVGCAVALHYHPEWRDGVIVLAGVLAGFGLHLQEIAYTKDVAPPPS